jgi:hypothetical protein
MTPIFFSINFPPSGLDTDIGETTTCIFIIESLYPFIPFIKEYKLAIFSKKIWLRIKPVQPVFSQPL